jgi:hypothetical protein
MGSVKDEGGTAPGVDPSVVSTEHLLRSSAWQARLDEARRQREKVLAERAGHAEPPLGPKPWERRPVAAPADLAARRTARTAPGTEPTRDPAPGRIRAAQGAGPAAMPAASAPARPSADRHGDSVPPPAPIPQPTLIDPVTVDNGHAEAMFAAMRTARLLRQSPPSARPAATPTGQTAARPATAQPAPAQPAPFQPTPFQPVPAQPVPAQPAPVWQPTALAAALRAPLSPEFAPPQRGRRSLPVVAGAFAFGLAVGLGIVFLPGLLERLQGAAGAAPATLSSTAPATFSAATAQPAPAPLAPAVAAPAPEAPGPVVARPVIQPDTPIIDLSARTTPADTGAPGAAAPVPRIALSAPAPAIPDLSDIGTAQAAFRGVGRDAGRDARPTGPRAATMPAAPVFAADAAPVHSAVPAGLPVVFEVTALPPSAPQASPLPRIPAGAAPALPTPLASLAAPAATTDAAPAAVATPIAPAGFAFAGTDVLLLVPERTPDGERTALSDRMASAGFAPAAVKDVGMTIRATHVRFYHEADAAAARVLADVVGGEARDFTSFRKPPPGGTIELWVASTPPAAGQVVPARPAKTAKAAGKARNAAPRVASEQAQLDALKARIVARLRNGDHL